MGIKDRLFGRKDDAAEVVSREAEAPGCLHADLAERWDDAADMGKMDRISGYECRGCHQHFSPEEGQRLQAENEARLKETMAGS
ncbi:MAG: hypothetical protein GEU80_05185 [Dehalococcoidia bacterium]|nr:hypothetical protein [Dehalococcoidia bacterium]